MQMSNVERLSASRPVGPAEVLRQSWVWAFTSNVERLSNVSCCWSASRPVGPAELLLRSWVWGNFKRQTYFKRRTLIGIKTGWSCRGVAATCDGLEYAEALICNAKTSNGNKTGWSYRGAATTLSMRKRRSAMRKRQSATIPVGPTEVPFFGGA